MVVEEIRASDKRLQKKNAEAFGSYRDNGMWWSVPKPQNGAGGCVKILRILRYTGRR